MPGEGFSHWATTRWAPGVASPWAAAPHAERRPESHAGTASGSTVQKPRPGQGAAGVTAPGGTVGTVTPPERDCRKARDGPAVHQCRGVTVQECQPCQGPAPRTDNSHGPTRGGTDPVPQLGRPGAGWIALRAPPHTPPHGRPAAERPTGEPDRVGPGHVSSANATDTGS
jgi:hypothetical protein